MKSKEEPRYDNPNVYEIRELTSRGSDTAIRRLMHLQGYCSLTMSVCAKAFTCFIRAFASSKETCGAPLWT